MNEAVGKSNLSLGWELLIERELAFQIKLVGSILWTGNAFWECQGFSLKRGPLQWPRECCGAAPPGTGASIILARLALGRLLLFSADFAVLLRMVRLLNWWGLKQVARLFLHCRGWFQLSTVADLDYSIYSSFWSKCWGGLVYMNSATLRSNPLNMDKD